MVQFGDTLSEVKTEDWGKEDVYYIDYHALKVQLRQLKSAYDEASEASHGDGRQDGDAASSAASLIPSLSSLSPPPAGKGIVAEQSAAEQSASWPLRRRLTSDSLALGKYVECLEDKFRETLDAEVEKVVLSFLGKQGELARRLLNARRQQGRWETDEISTFQNGTANAMEEEGDSKLSLSCFDCSQDRSLRSVFCSIGREIAELMQSLQLNVSGVRKILQNHDKQIRDKLIATHYLSTKAREKYSCIRQLYSNDGVMALVASLQSAFEDFKDSKSRHPSPTATESLDSTALLEEGGGLASPSEKIESATGSYRGTKQTLWDVRTLRRRSLSDITDDIDDVLNEIAEAQKALAEVQHRSISEYLSLQVLLDGCGGSPRRCARACVPVRTLAVLSILCLWPTFLCSAGLSSLYETGEISDDKRELHQPSAWINLGTTFLYMMNYYIMGPTSAEYAAVLGGSPAASGLILGMTPIAACFSCLLYSWWTNTSFRQPLMLCTVMLIVGNLLYAMALSSDAFWVVLLGRALIGLGGTHGVNRRYIADTIPAKSRTAYSAAFVVVGSVGMAVGPFISAMMTEVDFTIVGVRFNGLTNPGWIMFMLWVVMGFLICTVFQEPRRCCVATAANQDSPEDIQVQALGLKKPKAVWSTETATADDAAPPSINRNINGKVKANIDGGKYGSTGCASLEHHTESGAVLPTTAIIDGGEGRTVSSCSLGAISHPLAACLFGYFANKLVTEVAICSAPVLTHAMFDWTVFHVGCMMSVLGILVLPVNAAVGYLSRLYEDRALLQVLAAVTALGCLVAVEFSWMPFEYTHWQYMVGVGVAFLAMQAHEGVVMSITTKVIPAELARGTWNLGFLTTEAGTLGRFVGDALITAMGVMTLSSLNILLFLPSMVLVGLMILAFARVYPFLQGE